MIRRLAASSSVAVLALALAACGSAAALAQAIKLIVADEALRSRLGAAGPQKAAPS